MKKGFTLIEMVSVIILMAIFALLILPTVQKQIIKGKNKMLASQVENISMATQMWLSDNALYEPNDGDTITIMLSQLKQDNYIKKDIKNPLTGDIFPNDMLIEITKNNGVLEYKVLLESGSDFSTYDESTPSIVLKGNAIINAELNEIYTDLGVIAKTNSGDIISEVTVTNNVNTSLMGTYSVIYSVTYNDKTNSLIRTVNVKDMKAPILIVPATEISVYDNQLISTDLKENVTYSDNSGSASLTCKIDGDICGSKNLTPGFYTAIYTATDASSNLAMQNKIIKILASGNPIFVIGQTSFSIIKGENYNLLASVSATDANGYAVTNITCSINGISCSTSSLEAGTYTINYVATDLKSNITTATRMLVVNEP